VIVYNATMDYDFEKLAREITAERLKPLSNVPDAAAEVAAKIILAAVASTRRRQDPGESVAAVCRGVMSGLVLIEKDLKEPALAVLGKIGDLAGQLGLDPQKMMTAAMTGVADAAVLGPAPAVYEIRMGIDSKFMGAGEVFDRLAELAKARRSA